MSYLAHIADKAFNRPLLLTPAKTRVLLEVLGNRIGVSPQLSEFAGSPVILGDDGVRKAVPFNVSNGVGIITLSGSLVNRGAWLGSSSGLISYEGLQYQIAAAKNTAEVKSVVLDLDCPGGEAAGCFKTAGLIRDLAASKPVIAVVNSMAASGGYALASGATEIVTEPDGILGSIGVVMVHTDYSKFLEQEGITPTIMFAGAHKVDGNMFEPLGDEVKAEWQAEMMQIYDEFVQTVATGRGQRMSADQARATQARVYRGQDAVDVGLADRVGTFESVLVDLNRARGRTTKGSKMDDPNAPAATAAGITQAQVDTAVSSGVSSALTAERERMTRLDAYAEKYVGNPKAIEIIKKAKTEGTGADATASLLIEAGVTAGAAVVAALKTDDASARAAVPAAPGDATVAATTPEGWKAEWEASKELQAAYPKVEYYTAFMKASAAGRAKVFAPGAQK